MLKIHFLNVGHGDCTFLELPSGRLMMIDINNSKALPEDDVVALAENEGLSVAGFKSLELAAGARSWKRYYEDMLVDPYNYYVDNFAGKTIFRYIQTHPDMDHMSGLHRFFWQEETPLQNFWDVTHARERDEDDFGSQRYEYLDWLTYKILRNGVGPNDDTHRVINKLRGNTGDYWTPDEIEILSPTQDLIDECNDRDNYNDCSYVLKISHAGRSVILPGDAGHSAWESMLLNLGWDALKCDILKASHHGRLSGYHEDAVLAMSPEVVICSVGKKPETDASRKYTNDGAKVFSTRYSGCITATIWDDGEVWIQNRKNEIIHTIT